MTDRASPLTFPATEPSAATGFAGGRLDRLSERRGEAAMIARLRADGGARHILFLEDRAVLRRDGAGRVHALWPGEVARALGARADGHVLLGVDGAGPVFAGALREAVDGAEAPGGGTVFVTDLRSLAQSGALAPDIAGAVAQGRSLVGWHATHGFCARCGTATVPAEGGYRRDCPSCGAHHFPRTDPVVIMLAVDGERGLLGRQHRFQPGMYSCLAGFVEPGETLENAVRREVGEEAGIRVGRVLYHASQPWPFPSSLMIGCFAEALSRKITRQEDELEDARFFGREEMELMLARRHPDGLFVPPPMAIAHHLIRAFVEG